MAPSVLEQIRTLHAWSPLLGYARRLSTTLDARERAVILGDMAEWISERTATRFDDRLAARLSAVLKTPEGVELVREVVAIVDQIADSLPQETDS